MTWGDRHGSGERARCALTDGASRGRHGFTLLELMLVMSVMVIAFLALSQSLGASIRLTEANRERRLATDGARQALEQLQGFAEFDRIFETFQGTGFAVEGLSPVEDDPDGLVGEFVFPTLSGELREDIVMPELGMPRDLNGDGLTDSVDHAGDYRLLPVELRLRWDGPGGERTMRIRSLIADR